MNGNILKGVGVYPGLAIGESFIYQRPKYEDIVAKVLGSDITLGDVEQVVSQVCDELSNLMESLSQEKGLVEILEFQVMILEDEFLDLIREKTDMGKKVSKALVEVIEELYDQFIKKENIYMKERAQDIRDIGLRVMKKLVKYDENEIPEGRIIVTRELYASEIFTIKDRVIGIVSETGTALSHFAIIAREFGLPTIVGVKNVVKVARNSKRVILNGLSGEVIIDPSEEVEVKFRAIKERWDAMLSNILADAKKEAVTRDGSVKIKVVANIGKAEEIENAAYYGAEGIGLFRTEFFFLGRGSPPSENEQFNVFKFAAQRFHPNMVTIRTLDIGSDKDVPYIPLRRELNPSLGKRAIRLYWDEISSIIKTQIKAILKSSKYGLIGIMIPMVSDLNEIIKARKLVEEIEREIREEGGEVGNYKFGIMVETPSAALLADLFSDYIDFISFGTNDLTQYTLAIDRAAEEVPDYFDHLHPSVIRLIKYVIDLTKGKGIEISVCGESASDLLAVPILIGLGIRKLSVSPMLIPVVKHTIRLLDLRAVEDLAKTALKKKTPGEIRELVKDFYRKNGIDIPI